MTGTSDPSTEHRTVRMHTDYCVGVPLWPTNDLLHEGITLSGLLEAALRAWNRRWEELASDPDTVFEGDDAWTSSQAFRAWSDEGLRLARWLRRELPADVRLVYNDARSSGWVSG